MPASFQESAFTETEERRALRRAVGELARGYGPERFLARARAGERTDDLWHRAGSLGYLGVNLPAEYGGGGAGIYELALVLEELGAAGCPLLMLIVTPAICGSVIARFGTPGQKRRWLPGFADGTVRMSFAITEPDAGSNTHRLTTVGRRTADGWRLSGRKVFVSGLDGAAAVLVVGRTEDARTGRLRPALYVVPTDAPGVEYRHIPMEIVSPERQYHLFLDDVALPADALVGDRDPGLLQLFAGLNPERIMAAAFSVGLGRHALDRAVAYARERTVWDVPVGAHQGVAHPLAQARIELECARLMMQKAAHLYDAGDDPGAGEAANMAKYAAAEAGAHAVDQAVHTLGGNGLTQEYGIGSLLAVSRVGRIAPVSREMILNYVAQHTLGLPRSY